MWKMILRAAVLIGRSEWAKRAARSVIARLRHKHSARLRSIADIAGIPVPPTSEIRQSRLVRTPTDMLKPGQVVLVDGEQFRITRLISCSAAETIYEADALP